MAEFVFGEGNSPGLGDGQQQAEKKQVTGQESVSDKCPAILESEKDKVIQQTEEDEKYPNIVAFVSEGNRRCNAL